MRIIGGHYRRRILRFPDSEGLRPTPDRVRETLFNWLGQELDGLTILPSARSPGIEWTVAGRSWSDTRVPRRTVDLP